MKLAFCVIVEGDEKLEQLKRLMASVTGLFNSYHITANHKHIKTEKWCKEKGYDFSYLKWSDDFSAQRNFNFARVPKDTDYICWADSDDVVIHADLIPEIAENAKKNEIDAVFFHYIYGAEFDGEPSPETFVKEELGQTRERLLKRGSIVWKKRLHESPVPIDGEKFVHSSIKYDEKYPIAWLHLGADRDQPQDAIVKRTARNRKMLEMDLADERKEGEADPRTLLYLMKLYAEESDNQELLLKCLDMGKEYIEKSGWDEERAVCYKLMATCMGHLGRHEDARDLLMNAIKEFPYDPLLYLHLARAYRNLENWGAMKHWMKIGMDLNLSEARAQMDNILELKVLGAELMLEFYLHGDKNIRKAWEASRLLNKVNPTDNNKQNEEYLFNRKELDLATEHAHKLLAYYKDIGKEDLIAPTIETFIEEIRELPFMIKLYNHYKEPKVWEEKEICYYATFGHDHFERWGPSSLKAGIGGSETAVIRLSQEWAKLGYKVTVYADPGKEMGEHDEVTWLPYYKFNPRDKFNIFIQWRDNSLAGKVSAKKFLVDLHDVYFPQAFLEKMDSIDTIMVKSVYQRDLGEGIPKEKYHIISNGI
jgi:tetratricopeptide (TPR) repeat protein